MAQINQQSVQQMLKLVKQILIDQAKTYLPKNDLSVEKKLLLDALFSHQKADFKQLISSKNTATGNLLNVYFSKENNPDYVETSITADNRPEQLLFFDQLRQNAQRLTRNCDPDYLPLLLPENTAMTATEPVNFQFSSILETQVNVSLVGGYFAASEAQKIQAQTASSVSAAPEQKITNSYQDLGRNILVQDISGNFSIVLTHQEIQKLRLLRTEAEVRAALGEKGKNIALTTNGECFPYNATIFTQYEGEQGPKSVSFEEIFKVLGDRQLLFVQHQLSDASNHEIAPLKLNNSGIDTLEITRGEEKLRTIGAGSVYQDLSGGIKGAGNGYFLIYDQRDQKYYLVTVHLPDSYSEKDFKIRIFLQDGNVLGASVVLNSQNLGVLEGSSPAVLAKTPGTPTNLAGEMPTGVRVPESSTKSPVIVRPASLNSAVFPAGTASVGDQTIITSGSGVQATATANLIPANIRPIEFIRQPQSAAKSAFNQNSRVTKSITTRPSEGTDTSGPTPANTTFSGQDGEYQTPNPRATGQKILSSTFTPPSTQKDRFALKAALWTVGPLGGISGGVTATTILFPNNPSPALTAQSDQEVLQNLIDHSLIQQNILPFTNYLLETYLVYLPGQDPAQMPPNLFL